MRHAGKRCVGQVHLARYRARTAVAALDDCRVNELPCTERVYPEIGGGDPALPGLRGLGVNSLRQVPHNSPALLRLCKQAHFL